MLLERDERLNEWVNESNDGIKTEWKRDNLKDVNLIFVNMEKRIIKDVKEE